MNKYQAITIICVIIAIFTSLAIKSYQDGQIEKEAIKAGLEECPNWDTDLPNRKVWVKSCSEFTKLKGK